MHTPTQSEKITMTTDTLKVNLLEAARVFIRQRSGINPRDYDTASMFHRERDEITQALQDAVILLNAVERSAMTGQDLLRSFDRRLTAEIDPDTHAVTLDYTTGQYFAMEYRRAACSVAADALWDFYRDAFKDRTLTSEESWGDAIRRQFAEKFGSRIQSKYFN